MLGHCDNCHRDNVEVHRVKAVDDMGFSTMNVCDPCDEYDQGVISEKDWREITGQKEEPHED